jgi:Spy/CpxP family protein refolding chaperone
MRLRTFLPRIAAALLAVPLAASIALAEPPHDRPPGGPPWTPPDERLEAHLRELGLDSAQFEKVHAILSEAKRTREQSDGRMRKAFDEMRALLEQDKPDEAAVMQQADRIGSLLTEGRKAMLRALLAVRADLTPEQRQKLNEMMRRDGPPGGPGMPPHGPGSPPDPAALPGKE